MRARRIFINFLTSILVVAIICISFFSLVCIVFNFTHIKSGVNQFSMYPTLNGSLTSEEEEGDTVYINKFKTVTRGDIVVVNVSWNESPIIKRAVALPNDSLYMLEGEDGFELYVNDKLFYTMPFFMNSPKKDSSTPQISSQSTRGHYNLFKDYLAANPENTIIEGGITKLKLKQNQYFLLGDNWVLSKDSTTIGPVNSSQIIGAVDVVIHANQNKLNTLIGIILKMLFC